MAEILQNLWNFLASTSFETKLVLLIYKKLLSQYFLEYSWCLACKKRIRFEEKLIFRLCTNKFCPFGKLLTWFIFRASRIFVTTYLCASCLKSLAILNQICFFLPRQMLSRMMAAIYIASKGKLKYFRSFDYIRNWERVCVKLQFRDHTYIFKVCNNDTRVKWEDCSK